MDISFTPSSQTCNLIISTNAIGSRNSNSGDTPMRKGIPAMEKARHFPPPLTLSKLGGDCFSISFFFFCRILLSFSFFFFLFFFCFSFSFCSFSSDFLFGVQILLSLSPIASLEIRSCNLKKNRGQDRQPCKKPINLRRE